MIDYNTFEWPEITKDTPLSEVKRIHQLIWDYVIVHGKKPETPYISDCALCKYADSICKHCPAEWPENGKCVGSKNSLYSKWLRTKDPELAKRIRDIPFKEEPERKKLFHVFVKGIVDPIKTKNPVGYFENWSPGALCKLYDREGGEMLAVIPSDNIIAFIAYETGDET